MGDTRNCRAQHRVGGLEKAEDSGHVSYDPENHHRMVELRQEKVNRIQNDIDPTEVYGEKNGDLLIISWGGTYGSCRSAVETLHDEDKSVSHVHLKWINPLPKDLVKLSSNLKMYLFLKLTWDS